MARTRNGCARARRAARRAACLALAGALLGASDGVAEADGDAEQAPPAPVDIESLFRLPSEMPPPPSRAGGMSQERWEERFTAAHQELREAEESLQQAQQELEAIASGSESWQIAAPGAQPTSENSPLSYKLRQEIRRRREAVSRAKQSLRELETEASLAGIPKEWRQPPPRHEDAVPQGSAR